MVCSDPQLEPSALDAPTRVTPSPLAGRPVTRLMPQQSGGRSEPPPPSDPPARASGAIALASPSMPLRPRQGLDLCPGEDCSEEDPRRVRPAIGSSVVRCSQRGRQCV